MAPTQKPPSGTSEEDENGSLGDAMGSFLARLGAAGVADDADRCWLPVLQQCTV